MYTNLLDRQIKRYLKGIEGNDQQNLAEFLAAINQSYEHYERDHLLNNRSIEISTNELNYLAQEIANKETRLRATLDAATDGILISHDNDVELCNEAAATYLGISGKSEFKSEALSKLVERTTHGLHEIALNRENEPQIFLELSVTEIPLAQPPFKICIFRNVTHRKQSEKKIAVRHEISHLLFKSENFEQAFSKIISFLCRELGYQLGFVWLDDPKEKELKVIDYYSDEKNPCFDDIIKKKKGLVIKSDATDLAKMNFESYVFQDAYSLIEEGKECSLKTYRIVPISFGEEILGLIELFSNVEHSSDPQLEKILQDIGNEIGMYILRHQSHQKESTLQKELTNAAYQAGMAQVAASVIHNIGNVLNTTNLSIHAILDKTKTSELDNLTKIAELLKMNQTNLQEFLSSDARGKHIPDLLIALGDWWSKEKESLSLEVKSIISNVGHIINIIRMQQTMANLIGIKENIALNELLDDLLKMHKKDFEREAIIVKKEFGSVRDIMVDRCKLLQILENLILNAIDAIKGNSFGQRSIEVHTSFKDSVTLQIEIKDNGCGIDPDQLIKIFNYGFTTKENGHGFGLHSSSVLAKEMGGSLLAYSQGAGTGACFTLLLPRTNHRDVQ